MKRIFKSREFSSYHVSSLFESRSAISERYLYSSYTTVFLSHKHDDLDDLKFVAFYDGTETYTNGNLVERGYYVCVSKNGIYTITPLADWFAAR